MAAELLDPITLSALQHWCYCPRQCALIHVEQVFAENLFTQRGQALHKRVDDPCLLYTSPSPRDRTRYRMPSSA